MFSEFTEDNYQFDSYFLGLHYNSEISGEMDIYENVYVDNLFNEMYVFHDRKESISLWLGLIDPTLSSSIEQLRRSLIYAI